MNATRIFILIAMFVCVLGCGENKPDRSASGPQPAMNAPPPPPPPPATSQTKVEKAAPTNVPPSPPPPPSAVGQNAPASSKNRPTQTAPDHITVKAERGVGKKGHYDEKGVVRVITTPVATLFAARERMVFDISIPQAMNLFKATEGRAPKSHEEFMQRIIKENNISLPQLPEGHRYIYDPQTEQLMVEKPAGE